MLILKLHHEIILKIEVKALIQNQDLQAQKRPQVGVQLQRNLDLQHQKLQPLDQYHPAQEQLFLPQIPNQTCAARWLRMHITLSEQNINMEEKIPLALIVLDLLHM